MPPIPPGSSSRPIVLAACLGKVERPYNSLAINDGLYGGSNPKTGQHVYFFDGLMAVWGYAK